MILIEKNAAEVSLTIYAVNPDGSEKLDVVSGTVRVYYMSGGVETVVLGAQALVRVGVTNKWRYNWTPATLPVREYVAEYAMVDSEGISMKLPEDVVVRDLADMAKQSTLILLQADMELVRKVETGRWHIINNQMIFYDDDEVTPLLVFNLFDNAGVPTMENVFERVRTP